MQRIGWMPAKPWMPCRAAFATARGLGPIETLHFREVVVFLVAAGVVVPLARRLGVSPVLGFLVVGLLIGPYGIARFADMAPWLRHVVIYDIKGVRALAELGVVFLLFMIGLELSVDRLWRLRRLVFGLGAAQVVATGVAIGAIAWIFGNDMAVAVILGSCFALSSTAIVMQLLTEGRRLGTTTGQTSFAILLFQDLAVLPILFLVGALAARTDGPVVVAFGLAIGQALLAVAVILVLGRLVVRPLFRFIGKAASREMFLALVLLVIVGTALATHEIGLSMALGAFLAGLLLAETEYRHEIAIDIDPFKGLLLGLFFVSVGMSIDIARVAERPLWLAASVVGLFALKAAVIYALVRLFGAARSVALEVALLLGQGGEFAFLVISLSTSLDLLPPATAQFMLIVTGLTMIATPAIASLARRASIAVEARAAQGVRAEVDVPQGLSGHVIVVGYGRVGQMIGSFLAAQGIPHVALDNDPSIVGGFRRSGASVFLGDASRPDLLRKFGADRALALVVTMDDPEAAELVVEEARRLWPRLSIYARARDNPHARRLVDRGASHVVPELTEASLQLGQVVLTGIGIPEQAARHAVDTRRQAEEEAVGDNAGGESDGKVPR